MPKEKIEVIYKNDNMLALSKPAGVLVHGVATNDKRLTTNDKTLVDWLIEKFPEVKEVGDDKENRPGIVHRLDKNTSGVILVARNQGYFEYLKNLFQSREMKKTYKALVYGKLEPRAGIIDKPIALKSGSIKRTVWEGRMEKPAVTEYKVLKYIESELALTKANKLPYFSLLEAYPKTGRTHQIRIHLSSVSHPIVGDSLYGLKSDPFGLNRQFLHAESLEWSAENGRRIKIECELPKDLMSVLETLGYQPKI